MADEHDETIGGAEHAAGAAVHSGSPLAAMALAVVSLIGMNPAQLVGQSLLYHHQDFRALATAPGIGVVVAAIALWLSRRDARPADEAWVRGVARSASVVAGISLIVNLAAFVGLITVSRAGGFVTG